MAEAINIPRDAVVLRSSESYEILESRELNKLVVIVFRGPQNKKLKEKIVAAVCRKPSSTTLMVTEYVVEGLSDMYPRLIPFILESEYMFNLAEYLCRRRSKSKRTLQAYTYFIERFSKWIGVEPNILMGGCFRDDGVKDGKKIAELERRIDEWLGELEYHGLAPKTVSLARTSVKTFFEVNGIKLNMPKAGRSITVYHDRAPTPEELQKLMEIADLREKVIISMLALGGFREETLTKLRYRHVKRDLERGIVPVHIHVEASITKGRYHDYDTFIGAEAVEYLKLYLEQRRRGTEKIPPEEITDDSPLIRACSRDVKPITTHQVHRVIHTLYERAGLIVKVGGGRYDLRVHSLRKYFRTQLASLGVPSDYIEYMMGHTISTYHDIKMKGVEFLRRVYASANLSIKPESKIGKLDILKEFAKLLGLNPEEIFVKEAFSKPWRTICGHIDQEEEQARILQEEIKKLLERIGIRLGSPPRDGLK
ncbi:MAG: site-specific integrase [Candidatus Bathyarchaeia archaeon]